MIATADPFAFQSKEKQCASNYFKANPTGSYDHFQDTWKRSAQVSRGIFDEVYTRLQKSGAIGVVMGGKAHEQLAKEIEARLIREGKLSPRPAEPLEVILQSPPGIPATPVQAPLNFPNAVPEPTTTEEDEVMAKEITIRQLTDDQRLLFDKTLTSNPNIGVDDMNDKLGVNIARANFSYAKSAAKRGSWHFTNLNGAVLRGGKGGTRAPAQQVSGHIPFINNTKISSPQSIGFLNTEGLTPADIKFIGTRFPSIISEIFAPNMTFKFYRTSEFEAEGEVEKLELRRIK